MIIWTFRIQKLKIGSLADFEKKSFSSLFLMRKPLSSDQKWFLRPYFPLIGVYICIEKWSQIFVSGIGSAHSESEEKTLFHLKKVKKGKFKQVRSHVLTLSPQGT